MIGRQNPELVVDVKVVVCVEEVRVDVVVPINVVGGGVVVKELDVVEALWDCEVVRVDPEAVPRVVTGGLFVAEPLVGVRDGLE